MKNKLIVIVTLFALTITGCGQQSVDIPKQNSASLVQLNAYVVSMTATPDTIVKVDRKDCKECKGTGVIKSGDGIHTETCPFCEVKKGSVGEAPKKDEQAVDTPKLPNYNCCKDCICENCSCTYPGQCLIAKNNGWPVQVCNGDVCTTYWPQDENGVEYNPYNLLPEAKKPSHKKYQQPIKVDARGNPL